MATSNSIGEYKPGSPSIKQELDFDIKLKFNENDFVPLGIPNFKGDKENDSFIFDIIIEGKGVNQWHFIIWYKENVLYECFSGTGEIEEVVITAKSKKKTVNKNNQENLQKEVDRFWPAGMYELKWTGFDKNGIYDSAIMTDAEGLSVSIIGLADGKQKTYALENPLKFKYKEVDWVDVKIDKINRKIETTLRVNFRDGGEIGLNCDTGSRNMFEPSMTQTICPWDKVTNEALSHYNPRLPLKLRTKSFEDLKSIALNGISKYWSRNSNNIGKGVQIGGDLFQTFVNALQDESGMVAPKIIYFTNSEETTFTRSHNFELHRELYYYEGYTYHSNWKSLPKNRVLYVTKGWIYKEEPDQVIEFEDTAAHEVGHQLLFEFGKGIYDGRDYSYSHKGTSGPTWFNQDPLPGTTYPLGEIDLMKYADTSRPQDYFSRVILSQEDSLGLIWLSKISTLSILCFLFILSSCQKKTIKRADREIVDYYNGVVIDENKMPVEGVIVTLSKNVKDHNDLISLTDRNGYFKIKDKEIDIVRIQTEKRKLIFKKNEYQSDTVFTNIGQSDYRPQYDSFDGLFFIFKIPDTLRLAKE